VSIEVPDAICAGIDASVTEIVEVLSAGLQFSHDARLETEDPLKTD
jgi:hypothetical protein